MGKISSNVSTWLPIQTFKELYVFNGVLNERSYSTKLYYYFTKQLNHFTRGFLAINRLTKYFILLGVFNFATQVLLPF